MESYDIAMLAVVGLATLFGFMKGFAWQVASLASLVLSYILALRFADSLAPQLNADPRWSKYLAMLIIYCGTSLAVWLGFRMVSKGIDRIKLREFDRQMGGLFGLLKGALIAVIITFFAVTLTEQSRGAVLRSKSGTYITQLLHKATPVMPPELNQLLAPYIDKLNRGLDPTQTVEYPQLPNLPNLPNVNIPNVQLPDGFDPSRLTNPYQPGPAPLPGPPPNYESGGLPTVPPFQR